MKKYLLGLSAVAGVGSALAEAAAPTIDNAFSASSLATALTGYASTLAPILITVAACFLGFYVLKFAIRAIKSVASASK